MTRSLDLMLAAVERDLGDRTKWFRPNGYSAPALAILDSIYSTRNRYSGVKNALAKYRRAREGDGADAWNDGPKELIDAAQRWAGPGGDPVEALVDRTNKWLVSSKAGAERKAAAALGAAKILSAAGLETRGAVQAALTDPVQQETSPLKQEWRSLPGQSSALTWTYFLMLNGIPGVKADRMVLRYVSAATAEEVSAKDAAALVREVATRIGESATVLDHAIWRHQSGRPVEQVMPDTVGPVTSETGALPAQASSGIEDTEEVIITDA